MSAGWRKRRRSSGAERPAPADTAPSSAPPPSDFSSAPPLTDSAAGALAQAESTTALPLAWVYVVLIAYASLHPFGPWRFEGVEAWRFLLTPARLLWFNFDGLSNLVGYVPLGMLACVALMRGGWRLRARWAVLLATLLGVTLSFTMEALQSYTVRVPSLADWLFNSLGALAGAVLAALGERLGWLERWSGLRRRWFTMGYRGTLALLALWPFALLYPAAVPLGLGQVLERAEEALALWFLDTPFLEWLPMRDVELQPLVPGVEALCVALGALAPCLLAYSIVPRSWRRGVAMLMTLAAAMGVSSLSAALSYGPQNAWAWFTLTAHVGLILFVFMAVPLAWVPPRGCAVLALLAFMLQLTIINQAPTNAYFALTLQSWEQGRFARFNGLGEWLGWLWPYLAVCVLAMRLATRSRRRAPPIH